MNVRLTFFFSWSVDRYRSVDRYKGRARYRVLHTVSSIFRLSLTHTHTHTHTHTRTHAHTHTHTHTTDEMGLFLFCNVFSLRLAIFACRACHSSGILFSFWQTNTHTPDWEKRCFQIKLWMICVAWQRRVQVVIVDDASLRWKPEDEEMKEKFTTMKCQLHIWGSTQQHVSV